MEIIVETADCEKVQATTVIFRGKSLSKNKLTCKNAVARIYGSCTLRVMGSCPCSLFIELPINFSYPKTGKKVLKHDSSLPNDYSKHHEKHWWTKNSKRAA